MTQSEHYNLKIVEGSDYVNPLLIDNDNYEAIDDIMFDNECAGVGAATEVTTGTVHALTREKETQNVFRFRATSNYTLGDTFTVDGDVVSAQFSDGSALSNRCYIVGSEVLCSLVSGQLTLYTPKIYDANNVMNGTKSVKENIDELTTSVTNLGETVSGIKFDILGRIDANTNETWASVLGRLRDTYFDDMSTKLSYYQLGCNLDGVNGIYFTPSRVYSNAQNTYWFAVRPSSSGVIIYAIVTSGTSASLYKYGISTGGLTITNMSEQLGSSVVIKGATI